MNVVIEVSGLHKAFGAVDVLAGIDLSVRRGTVHALLGPNGAGKTTLVHILATLVRPDAGTARIAGADLLAEPAQVRRRIALTGQSAAVDDVLTAAENLRMMARLRGLRGRAARRRAAELIERFGLVEAAGRRVKTFSGGMRRRLDLALSLVVAADVVFLDEPTTGLDPRSRRELWEVIGGLRTSGTTVLLTTQYLEEADELADRVSILGGGSIVAEGTPAELKRTVGEERVELRDHSGALLHAEPTDGSSAGLRRALDVIDRLGLTGELVVRRPSLDDVFFALTETAAGSGTSPDGASGPAAPPTRPLAATGRTPR
ncbi:ATP-binding cassette domain-containing protein [Ruania albidiflava]|uniref:ATP-binding cassette domain-containing protein n=1 Tax=Ruania albidiflava TaxID=366586 RepID=UPI0023F16205|nr:ATP-binding cassette domain-containing protein [Ruania albidiflava]